MTQLVLHRGLSARQVQMIAIAGTIGTGLFLGTGKSLAEGGPASILICYCDHRLRRIHHPSPPRTGSFNAYTTRFFSPSYGFALSWNYWFNDAVSVASDLTAAQLVLQFWTSSHPWVISLLAWVVIVSINALHVRAYGELEYWLSFLKVITIIIFIILGILVNVGVNTEHTYIGGHNWSIPGAPFVNGFSGFANVFVTASFAYGGTESLGITAGETKNPSRNMPKVVKFVFWRILLFYVLSILFIGLNGWPHLYQHLSPPHTFDSPVGLPRPFEQDLPPPPHSRSYLRWLDRVCRLLMHTVSPLIPTSRCRFLYEYGYSHLRLLCWKPRSLCWYSRPLRPLPRFPPQTSPCHLLQDLLPLAFLYTALLATSSISILCFASSFIGSGQLWGWLQNIVGVSNQIAWLSIGLASWRFRRAWISQNRSVDELKFYVRWTWPWGPYFVSFTVLALILIQGWSSIFPAFSAVDFVSFYIQILVMIVMYTAWALAKYISAAKPVSSGDNLLESVDELTPLSPLIPAVNQ
ncbi:amino acid permease-domain-containing protein [Chiua virens]|nr:amino acid permease-domain-containing protein [Chiua virens]